VRVTLLLITVPYFLLTFLASHTIPFPPFTVALSAALVAFGIWRVRTWSARHGWDARHRLAVAVGVLLFFPLFWAPLFEFVDRQDHPERAGLVLVNFVFMVGLAVFGWHLARVARRAPGPDARVESGLASSPVIP
jgi:hypothetical protein